MSEEVKDEKKETTTPTATDPGKTYTAEEVEAMRANDKQAMERLHKKAATAETKHKELIDSIAAAEKEAERAKLEEVERLKLEKEDALKELNNLREQHTIDRVTADLRLAAVTNGAHDPDDVVKMVNLDSLKDDDGNFVREKVEKSIEDLKEKKPYLFGRPGALGTPPDPTGGRRQHREPPPTLEDYMKRREEMFLKSRGLGGG